MVWPFLLLVGMSIGKEPIKFVVSYTEEWTIESFS
jgi:hypothetical protein